MGRREVLSAEAIEFLRANGCAPEYPLDQLKDEAALLRLPFSALQLETVAALWNVRYASRSAFQQSRYGVAFFNAQPGESICGYLKRRSYTFSDGVIIADCDTDETHEPEGLVLHPSGALALPDSPERMTFVYRSAYMVVERDTFLDARDAEYEGSIVLKSSVGKQEVEGRLGDVMTFSASSDALNALWYSDDGVLLYQGWLDFYLRSLPAAVPSGAVLRVFGIGSPVFADVVWRLGQMVYKASEPRRPDGAGS